MRPTHLCGSLRGVDRDERREADQHIRQGFRQLRAPGNIIGNIPTCCLLLGLIMLMRELPHKLALLIVSSLRDYSSPPSWGALPLLIFVEGASYMTSPSRIRTGLSSNTNQIQVRVLTPFKGKIPHTFSLKPAHH
mgnify:CR=1 FL=1